MLNKLSKKVKVIIFLVVFGFIAWTFVIHPFITFKSNENKMEQAAKRYFELNSRELPAGERVKTLPLQKLYDGGLLEDDFYIPLSNKTCSNENSWIKVRKENGEYKYYTYLECGKFKSNIDHEGPVIKLKGSSEISIDKDSEYKEYGVRKVTDAVDGELKVSDVTIKGKVNTAEIGTYEIEYIAFDNMSNKTTVTRTVKVVRRLAKEVEEKLNGANNFAGEPTDNYLRLSNMIFRIYGLDENKNVIIVAETDVANINYSKIDKWLEYFYKNLNKKAQKMIVKSKFCSMTLDVKSLDSKKECETYTEEKKVYIPSVVQVNNAQKGQGNFMKPFTLSWVAEKKDDTEAYVTRFGAFLAEDEGVNYFAYKQIENYGIRPMMVINGKSLIVSGDGTQDNPYYFDDTKKVKGADLLNTREVGEYIYDDDVMWRIVRIMDDGATKVIATEVEKGYDVDEITCYSSGNKGVFMYNPKDKGSAGYCLNNKALDYFDTTKFANHEIEVPIYKDNIIYGEEIETKKYKAVLSAPNMYEMFSAYVGQRGSYWLINSSQKPYITGAITEIGVPVNFENRGYTRLAVRPVAYFKDNIILTSGKGTKDSPYLVK